MLHYTGPPYSPADNKWHSAIYEDSAVLTCGHDAQVCDDDDEGCIGLAMQVASSMQSIWDPHLIMPPSSPMMRSECLKFPKFPLIDLDKPDLHFVECPTSPTITCPMSSKTHLHHHLLHSFTLHHIKTSVQKHGVFHLPHPQLQIICPGKVPGTCPRKPLCHMIFAVVNERPSLLIYTQGI